MTPANEPQQFLSPELSHRLAAIDIGSNSLRLIVAEALRDGQYRVLDEEKETTRLAGKLSSTGRLDPEAVERAMTALKRMKQIADGYQVNELKCIATCAVREADDGEEFRRRCKQEIGLDIEVISGEQEAHLAFFSVARAFRLDGKDTAVCDIGGGSTEIILASGNIVEAVCTTPLGAVRLTEMFADEQGQFGDNYEKMIAWIDRELKRRTKQAILQPHLMIGSGGTFTAIADIVAAGRGQAGTPRRGFELTRAEVSHLADRLRKMSPKARRGMPGLSPDRADIITAGVSIVDRLMQHFRVNRVQVHDRGVRDGLLLTMIDRTLGPQGDNPHDQEAAIERFAVSCGTDVKHGKQVAKLAGMMLSQLIGTHGLTTEDHPLLEAAARLQDVGYLINYDQHHKHSYHLILNSRLAGFKPGDLEIIANVARYHRGALPKKDHSGYGRLAKPDRKRVKMLAGILRIAGGLDRSNSQNVQGIQVVEHDGRITLRVVAQNNPEVDIWAAVRRTELFEKAFDAKVAIEWTDPNRPQAPANEAAHEAAAAERAHADESIAAADEHAEASAEASDAASSSSVNGDVSPTVEHDNSSQSLDVVAQTASGDSSSDVVENAAPTDAEAKKKRKSKRKTDDDNLPRRRDAKLRKPSKAK
ncbi:MAG: Ppx/GppA phosphatase family protein [Pirellulales bacterium]